MDEFKLTKNFLHDINEVFPESFRITEFRDDIRISCRTRELDVSITYNNRYWKNQDEEVQKKGQYFIMSVCSCLLHFEGEIFHHFENFEMTTGEIPERPILHRAVRTSDPGLCPNYARVEFSNRRSGDEFRSKCSDYFFEKNREEIKKIMDEMC